MHTTNIDEVLWRRETGSLFCFCSPATLQGQTKNVLYPVSTQIDHKVMKKIGRMQLGIWIKYMQGCKADSV